MPPCPVPAMFAADAHSFSQQARLAITLAWVAGYTNILTILTCGIVTSHVSGTTSNLGRELAEGAWDLAAFGALIIICFFLGAVLSGACTELGRRRGWESIYVLPMAVEALLLGLFAVGLEMHGAGLKSSELMMYTMPALASAAMGLQNATITKISSGVVRTTHVTGVLTDLGLEAVQFLLWAWDRRRRVGQDNLRATLHSIRVHSSTRRLVLLLAIFSSFALGALLGTLAHHHALRVAMFPPVLFLAWIIYQDISRPIADIELSDLHGADAGLDLPEAIALFHVRASEKGSTKVHRLPNLVTWADRLPPATRVVVLDLGPEARLDTDSASELRGLLLRLRVAGRRLLLVGLGPEQQRVLSHAWGEDLRPGDVFEELELALAHAIILSDVD